MPHGVVATVAPCLPAGRPNFRGARGSGKRLSADGCREFAIGKAKNQHAVGQPLRVAQPKPSELVPSSRRDQAEGPEPELAWDADGEVFMLCPQCWLPLGDSAYTADDDEGHLVHAECKAQLLLRATRREEEARLKKDSVLKKQRREEFDLGWKVERAPRNFGPAAKLACGTLPSGLCSLIWDEESKTVRPLPTSEPSASVNLEYLSLALQVRLRDGREPLFSLDPKDVCTSETRDKRELWQVKRFEPQWLEGTSAGEVMFQADYHLKELSMGEFTQPVVGMKSSFDYSEEEGFKQGWSAREWYVINKAEIQITEDNVVIPVVNMGVEARETCKGADGLEDVPLTRPDHPLVKYAQAFSHYFDLIAERKSVVFHLRELARATTLAKFLVESGAKLDGPWLALASKPVQASSPKEIPQLWNEHCAAQIEVLDGQIVASEDGIRTRMHGVYGGVQLQPRAAPAKVTAARVPSLTARMVSARAAIPEFAVGAPSVPKGVDLNLDQFDLSAVTKSQEPVGSWESKDFVGSGFWRNLSEGELAQGDMCLLKDVFHPNLSDRRQEGDQFIPPSSSPTYVSKLRNLVKEEAEIKKARLERFFASDFAVDNAGSLFPASWTPALSVAHGQKPAGAPVGLHPRPDYKAEASRLLKSATPAFDKCTEDGTCFRIYRIGNVEVRTTQESSGEEEVGAVFSSRAPARATTEEQWSTVPKVDKIVKVSEYVEKTQHEARRFYVVLETEEGDMIVTEQRTNQKATWVENPADLECRNSLAKVIRAADCHGMNITVQDAKRCFAESAVNSSTGSGGKCFAHTTFLCMLPARHKAWAALALPELQAVEVLGIFNAAAWDEGCAEVFRLSWESLGEIRREAARSLGYSESNWGRAGQGEEEALSAKAEPQKEWAELSQAEQEERMARWFEENYGSVGTL